MDVTELHDEENLLAQMQDRWERSAFLRPFGSKSDQRSSGRFAMRRTTTVWMGLPIHTTCLTWQVRQDSSCTRSDIKKYFARFVVLLLFIS